MFPSKRGLFKNTPCPEYNRRGKCKLPHCIFQHKRPDAAAKISEPEAKRLKSENGVKTAQLAQDPKPSPQLSPKPVSPPETIQLIPETMQHPPTSYPVRLQHLKIILQKLQDVGLDDISLARKLELEEAERSIDGTYRGNIRNLVRRILRKEYNPEEIAKKERSQRESKQHVLNTELLNLIVPQDKLSKRGYPLEIPEAAEKPPNFECDRCKAKVRFEDLETDSSCRFHLLRRRFDPEKKRLETTFPCCGATLEEAACQTRSTHVLKWHDFGDLQREVPFVATAGSGMFAVGVDCEMAYTTRGMELVRVTAIDWETSKIVLDRTVWPQGDVLDLNTRFSGISDLNAGLDIEGIHYPTLSFNQARDELLKLVGSKTILIGHGLENDVIALRIVHACIVDTAILYPRVKHRTWSLKQLAWSMLSREIQTGEHDSMEDTLAAMDVVKSDIMARAGERIAKSS